jgi:hypothetical protein
VTTELKGSINYVGYLVPGNQGDEALYKINQIIFGKYDFKLFPINNANKKQYSRITLVGGGSIIPMGFSWVKPTKYVYVFGAGVLDQAFYGYEHLFVDRLKQINFRLFGVRGNISKAFLEDWGIKSEVIGDPCLSLKPREVESKDKFKIGINIGSGFKGGSFGSQKRIINEMAKVCRILKKNGFDLILIPFWINNMQQVNRLAELEGISIFDDWTDVEATLQLISECKIFIGEKLHSLIFSAAANTPFVCLAYAPEHFDFLDSVGFCKYGVRTNEVTSEKVMVLFDDLLNNYETMRSKLAAKVNKYREKQSKFAARIVSDIESLPEDKWAVQMKYLAKILWSGDLLLYRNARSIWRFWNQSFFLHAMRYLV